VRLAALDLRRSQEVDLGGSGLDPRILGFLCFSPKFACFSLSLKCQLLCKLGRILRI